MTCGLAYQYAQTPQLFLNSNWKRLITSLPLPYAVEALWFKAHRRQTVTVEVVLFFEDSIKCLC